MRSMQDGVKPVFTHWPPDDWMYSSFDNSELYDIEACEAEDDCEDFEPTVSVGFLLGE